MRRALLILVASVAVIGLLTGGLAWLLTDPRPPAGASRAQQLYYAYCAQCHGVDGRGSWRASLFLLRPGDLADPRVAAQSDRYLFDLIKHGGATIGRPGMPAFGAQLTDEDIQLLVQYMRQLAGAGPARRGAAPFDHANRRSAAPVSEHRFVAGSDAIPETRVSRGRTPPNRADPRRADEN